MNDDRRRAEALLYELAAELRRLPVNEHTGDLHVRALAAKRTISSWKDEALHDAHARQRTIDSIVALQDDVRRWRRPFSPSPMRRPGAPSYTARPLSESL
jgi:hypothetical protein